MAIEFNAQFTKFVEFAQAQAAAGHSSAIARDSGAVAEGAPLAGRVISAATGDKVGALFRFASNKRANNDVRDLFKQAIIDMFGGADLIPKSVRDAMKTSDYNRGKPLTARRIMAVKVAIESATEVINPAETRAKANILALYNEQGEENRGAIDKLVSAMVNRAADDADVVDIAVSNGYSLLRAGNATLRSVDEVKKKVDTIKAAVSELRSTAKGNDEIFRLGKEMLIAMGGKAIPPGMIRSMVRAVSKLDISDLKSLNLGSPLVDVHLAAVRFGENVNKAMSASGADRAFTEAEELMPLRDFAAGLILARCDNNVADNITTLIAADENGGKTLNSVYNAIINRDGVDTTDLPPGLQDHFCASAGEIDNALSMLYARAQRKLGIPENSLQQVGFNDKEDYEPYMNIISDVLGRAKRTAQKTCDGFRANVVGGKSRGADALRDVYTRRVGRTAFNPAAQISSSRNAIIKGMINRRVCTEMSKFAKGGEMMNAEFVADVNSSKLNVTLRSGGNGEPIVLAGDYLTARDQLASFVTKGEKHNFVSLTSDEKNKVYIAMALLSNKTGDFASNAEMLALDPNGRTPAMQLDGAATHSMTLVLDDDGGLTFESKTAASSLGQVTIPAGNGNERPQTIRAGGGSKVESKIRFEIEPQEFDRLAGLDFAAYDDTVPANHIADQNARGPHDDMTSHMGGDFGFRGINCRSTCKITVN